MTEISYLSISCNRQVWFKYVQIQRKQKHLYDVHQNSKLLFKLKLSTAYHFMKTLNKIMRYVILSCYNNNEIHILTYKSKIQNVKCGVLHSRITRKPICQRAHNILE